MPFASSRPLSNPDRTQLSRRAVALILAIVIHALMIIVLLRQSWMPPPPKTERRPVTFNLAPDRGAVAAKASRATEAATAPPAHGAPERPAVNITKPDDVPPVAPSFLVLSREDFAAADIGRLPSRGGQRNADAGSAGGKDGGSDDGPGEGPGGERLYEADWYRRPTQAELATYIPAGAPSRGWGLVACRTVEKYRVEDCQELGESPRGSGLARAVRQAAWQFLVLPPRIGGRPMVGAWVRIRIDYTERRVE